MRVKEMHQLCCITPESPGIGEQSPFAGLKLPATHGNAAARLIGSEGSVGGGGVAGVLHKWTNYGKGWRSRWFVLRNGVLSYSKIRRRGDLVVVQAEDVRLIGDLAGVRLCTLDSLGSRRRNQKADRNGRFVQLKITSFRGSRSDDRRFYIFTTRKTLHLRADSSSDCVAWIEALISTRHLYLQRPVSNKVSLALPNAFKNISTQRLRNRLLEEGAGISESLVRDCEQIMLTELHEIHGQLNVLYEERSNLLETLRQMEEVNIESEGSGIHESDYNLTKPGFSSLVHGKSSESCTTESSDDIEKQEFREASDEAEPCFFDTEEHFSELTLSQHDDAVRFCVEKDRLKPIFPFIERRKRLPHPAEKEKGVSLWSMIKDNVGKDLTRVCLPVYFNEPISSLQKCFEDLEYSHLLDEAYEHGKAGNSLLRALNVAAFAVSGYASSEGRHRKPFNPLLGETYEADYPDKGIHFFSEKVSHHPTLIACHCEGKGWKFWGDSNLHSKFRGRSIQLDPVGVLNIEFDDGEVFQWSKVTTTIYNLILGKLYCDHHGMMNISSNRQFSCKLKFKEQSLLDRNPHEVHGFVEDQSGKKAATLSGKWDDSLYYVEGDGIGRCRDMSSGATLLWKSNRVPIDLTRYNLTPFAITLNELTPRLQEKLPPTDSRLRPDQRHLENGEYEKANLEKLRLERRQRMSRKLQESGWKPRWFRQESEEGPYRYVGGYWEAREQGKWDGCLNIFDQFDEDIA